jgi:hypothetical protein
MSRSFTISKCARPYKPPLGTFPVTPVIGIAVRSVAACTCGSLLFNVKPGSRIASAATMVRVTLDETDGRAVACAVIVTDPPFGAADGAL